MTEILGGRVREVTNDRIVLWNELAGYVQIPTRFVTEIMPEGTKLTDMVGKEINYLFDGESYRIKVFSSSYEKSIADIDRMAEKHGMKLIELTYRKGAEPSLRYRRKDLTEEEKAVCEQARKLLDTALKEGRIE